MLVAGGLYEQPVREWFAANYVGWIASFYERTSKPDGYKMSELTTEEMDLLKEIGEIRSRVNCA